MGCARRVSKTLCSIRPAAGCDACGCGCGKGAANDKEGGDSHSGNVATSMNSMSGGLGRNVTEWGFLERKQCCCDTYHMCSFNIPTPVSARNLKCFPPTYPASPDLVVVAPKVLPGYIYMLQRVRR